VANILKKAKHSLDIAIFALTNDTIKKVFKLRFGNLLIWRENI
tara:strand:- start:625 stop:753 length:129 start_codon:yes stop_codon:yes gene_type:complete